MEPIQIVAVFCLSIQFSKCLLFLVMSGNCFCTPPPHKSVKKWGISCDFRKQKFFFCRENRVLGRKKNYFSRAKIFFKINFFSSIFHDQKKFCFLKITWYRQKKFSLSPTNWPRRIPTTANFSPLRTEHFFYSKSPSVRMWDIKVLRFPFLCINIICTTYVPGNQNTYFDKIRCCTWFSSVLAAFWTYQIKVRLMPHFVSKGGGNHVFQKFRIDHL